MVEDQDVPCFVLFVLEFPLVTLLSSFHVPKANRAGMYSIPIHIHRIYSIPKAGIHNIYLGRKFYSNKFHMELRN